MLHDRTDKLCKTNKECSEFLQPWVNINWQCSLQTVSSSIHMELKLLSVTDRLQWQFSVLKSQNHLTLFKVVPEMQRWAWEGHSVQAHVLHPVSAARTRNGCRVTRSSEEMHRWWPQCTQQNGLKSGSHAWSLSTLQGRSVESSFTFQFLKSVRLNSSLWPKVSYISAQMFSFFYVK